MALAPAKWVKIFNGVNLNGWKPKITGHKFGENFGNTFRVVDGVIRVSYDKYDGEFKGRFGHLFYKKPYKNYIVRLEYRFTGEQIADGPGWAWRNSGIMIHCQDPKTMSLNQEFPVSLEVQLLGGPPTGKRTTGNVCSPGTNIMMDGKLVTQHCNDSHSDTFPGDQWVKAEAEVHGSGLVIHRINGVEVLRYEGAQFDPNDADAKAIMAGKNIMIDTGYISLQSESHPCEFRNVEVLELPQ